MTQLNTPYPATPYLTGFLRQEGYNVSQRDLAIDLFLSLLTDTSDEVFEHPAIITTIFEDMFQVLGFLLVFIGLRKWMQFNDKQNTELVILATTDELTGLYIRRYFLEQTLHEFERSQRSQNQFSILMIDIDNFKLINDKYGHGAGDTVLQVFAREIKSCIRKTDVIARWGGEEFIVLLVHDNEEITKNLCADISEKIRKKTESITVTIAKNTIRFTVSIGATVSTVDDESSDLIIDRADKLLYQAKIKGRNRVALDLIEKRIQTKILPLFKHSPNAINHLNNRLKFSVFNILYRFWLLSITFVSQSNQY